MSTTRTKSGPVEDIFSRSAILVGPESLSILERSSVAVVGLGGVGSYAVEALARAGVGRLVLMDFDRISPSNINRQIFALHSTLGQAKAEVARQRVLDINPGCQVQVFDEFVRRDDWSEDVLDEMDLVLDCIDSFSPKLHLIRTLLLKQQQFISSMGAAGKLDVSRVCQGQMSDTRNCPMARRLRKFLRKNQCSLQFPVVYSDELPRYWQPLESVSTGVGRDRVMQGSMVFVPAAFGITIASWACKTLFEGMA
ncbi:ThiF family adenylyltransferase [Desulfurispira natronophila]|uniref:tRNA A37 threonylcarbamoyladenosine dehydratase n=1 Tax=Desulfurispira natronophila TaxID=682562 RepID=A0A7W7Y4A0_9BACT|nr:tRNA A37 threonylcarbamoyladenosine dehydratase [Desulfurispira natronophila]